MRIRLTLVLAAVLCAVALPRAQSPALRTDVEAWVSSHERALIGELANLLSIPNAAGDKPNIARNVDALLAMLARHGFRTEALTTAGNPLVFGELAVSGATRTVLFYAHYDGQPVDAKGWKQSSPFTPILRDGRLEEGARELPDLATRDRFDPNWRVYARSASDDKSPIVALCAALDAVKATGHLPTSNVHVVLDGEEEAGSPSMLAAIAQHRETLKADAMVILDGPVHPSGRPTLTFGARGILTIELTVFGPKFGLHSGHYGNWVPNPAFELVRLLASMKDDRGRVLVTGFYDGLEPLAPEERAMLAAVPDDEASLKKLFGIAEVEQPGLSLQDAVQRPSLNIRGLSSAFVGANSRTIIPDRAVAAIDIRLVKETPSGPMLERVKAHIARQGFFLVDKDPDDATRAAHPRIVKLQAEGEGTNAYRTSPLDPASRQVVSAVTRVFGQAPVQIRTMGGTVPIAPFIDAMGFPAIGIPIVNFDNNQHGENENLRLGTFFAGITTLAAVLTAEPPQKTPATMEEMHRLHQNSKAYIAMLEDPERDAYQMPHEVVMALGLKDGDRVADIGAGSGYFALRFAQHVGATGLVYAVDINADMLAHITDRIRAAKLDNVRTIAARPDDPLLPAGSVDRVFICETWHHIENRGRYAETLLKVLRPGGRVIIVDFQKKALPIGPPDEMKLAREDVLADFQKHGFRLEKEETFLPYQYFLVFAPTGK